MERKVWLLFPNVKNKITFSFVCVHVLIDWYPYSKYSINIGISDL